MATIYSLENCGRQTGLKSVLCDGVNVEDRKKIGKICEEFKLEYVSSSNTELDDSIHSVLIRRQKSVSEYTSRGYVHYIYRLMNYLEETYYYDPTKATSLIPNHLIQPSETFVNFDSFFLRTTDRSFTKEKNVYWERKWKVPEDSAVISGSHPFFDLGLRVEIGDFNFLVSKMCCCTAFFGIDSGMAHLAGVLGVPSNVVVAVGKGYCEGVLKLDCELAIPEELTLCTREVNPSLIEYYVKSYRNTRVYKDFDILFG